MFKKFTLNPHTLTRLIWHNPHVLCLNHATLLEGEESLLDLEVERVRRPGLLAKADRTGDRAGRRVDSVADSREHLFASEERAGGCKSDLSVGEAVRGDVSSWSEELRCPTRRNGQTILGARTFQNVVRVRCRDGPERIGIGLNRTFQNHVHQQQVDRQRGPSHTLPSLTLCLSRGAMKATATGLHMDRPRLGARELIETTPPVATGCFLPTLTLSLLIWHMEHAMWLGGCEVSLSNCAATRRAQITNRPARRQSPRVWVPPTSLQVVAPAARRWCLARFVRARGPRGRHWP